MRKNFGINEDLFANRCSVSGTKRESMRSNIDQGQCPAGMFLCAVGISGRLQRKFAFQSCFIHVLLYPNPSSGL